MTVVVVPLLVVIVTIPVMVRPLGSVGVLMGRRVLAVNVDGGRNVGHVPRGEEERDDEDDRGARKRTHRQILGPETGRVKTPIAHAL